LDYSVFPSAPVTVNLQTGRATRNSINGGIATSNFASIEGVIGTSGADTLIGPNGNNTFAITAPNAGTLSNTGTLTFASMENLTGGAGKDIFRFSDGQLVSGTIDGQGETDLLDYSAYTSNITVDLTSGRATGTFAVIGIENVAGGQGNDLLRGNSADNTLVGGGGSDIILGMAGNDTIKGSSGRSLLLGGSGQDTLIAGGADDILIGGTTLYDLDDASLKAILKVWQQTDLSYADRIKTIKFEGVGINRNIFLNSSTVSDDGAADKLAGSTGLDWFWSFGQDTTDVVVGETTN
jgi:Ca2+-binding RTX toxin-like protein